MDDETTGTTEPRAHRSRVGIAMLVAAGLLLAGAGVVGVTGFQAKSEASDERSATATATHRRRVLATREQAAAREADDVTRRTEALPEKFTSLGGSVGDLADAQNHFVDVANHAADLYNQGDAAGAAAAYRTDGVSAVDAMAKQHDAAMQSLHDAQDALAHLQEVAR